MPVPKVTFGQSRLAFGCEQLGGHAWGVVDVREIQRSLELAFDGGIRLFDTADCYGVGESERRLGTFIRHRRTKLFVATKFGVRFDAHEKVYYDTSPQWISHALNSSLERLGTDYIDVYQLHHWDGRTALEDVLGHLERLRAAGKIRWYGVTNIAEDTSALASAPGLATVSLEYSLVNRTSEEVAVEAANAGLTFLAYGSLGQGILSGKHTGVNALGPNDRRRRPAYRNFHGLRLERNLRIVEELKDKAAALGTRSASLAIAWLLRKIPGGLALVGIKRPDQLIDFLESERLQVPDEVMVALDEVSADTSIGRR